MPAPTARHKTRALLRAHLAAASGYRHLTRNCPVCHRLQALAMEPLTPPQPPYVHSGPRNAPDPPSAPWTPVGAAEGPAEATARPPRATAEGGDEPPRGHEDRKGDRNDHPAPRPPGGRSPSTT
ncbi:DUF6274 family protein [Streptomyces griseus]|uniref:DUF6274 family protein n=1 Tax=Streptomyces griseus TaxID=1911 RepID=UPI00083FF65B|nr:DUF6274 family protein [Streptomyces griseus]